MELSADHFRDATKLEFTADPNFLSEADFIIIAVPTPIDKLNRPDFNPLEGACKIIGKQMKVGSTVIIESTVYPGATEEICIPILVFLQSANYHINKHDTSGSDNMLFTLLFSMKSMNK